MASKSTREAKQTMLRNFMETTIAQAAKAVFAEWGYQRATLEEIAQRAGMSKATIYIYYKNKDNLFLQVVEELVNATTAATAQAAEEPTEPLKKLYSIVRNKMEFYEQERDFFRIYLSEKNGLEVAPKDPHKRALREMYLQEVRVFDKILQQGMETGALRSMDSRRLAFFLREMISSVLVQRIQGKAKTSVDEDVEQILDLFLHGARRAD
jgi:AcrR family transcriptional regulator